MHGADNRGEDLVGRGRFRQTGRFGRLFPTLQPLAAFALGPEMLGAVGGPMDGGDPPPSDTSQDNPRIRAGYTFLGQFIDHDITLDATTSLEAQADPDAVENFRTPALELDSIYGRGPAAQPYLYDQNKPFRFLLDGKDLTRNAQGRALIGDPRNDENLIVAQLHHLFLSFHNKVFEAHTDNTQADAKRFEQAQRLVRWHYQWVVVNEFLPRIIGSKRTKAIFGAVDPSPPARPFMPVEFSVAAYRFGHSQVRGGYRMTSAAGASLFGSAGQPSLAGFRPFPTNFIVDWSLFFGMTAQPSKLIDKRLSTDLLNLPDGVVPPGTPPALRSLAVRNLRRGVVMGLPSGQSVASALQMPTLSDAEIWNSIPGGSGPAPLWYYFLREAEVRASGLRLADSGAELVGRVFRMLLQGDGESFLSKDPSWVPTLPSSKPGHFTMTDLVNLTQGLTIAGEDLSTLPGDD
jgi:hypothetical protein